MLVFKNKKIYFGDLHCHTGFSDGQLTPKEAFSKAREEGILDFMAVTDHAASVTVEKFIETKKAAVMCTTKNFVAIAGCENGFDESYENEYHVPVINGGELIVFGADTWCSSCSSLEEFTDILFQTENAIAGFAHPQEASWPTEKLWNGYDMKNHRSEKVQSFVRMIEVCNETSAYNLIHEKLYPTALDCGFHVSAIAVSDTHQANWGSKNLRARTAVYLEELTDFNIISALRNGQAYATETGNTILDFSINDISMGGTVSDTNTYYFYIDIVEPDTSVDCQISYVEIISDYGISIFKEFVNSSQVHLEPIIEHNSARYFYIRAVNKKGERIWSSPIFTGRSFDEPKKQASIIKLEKHNFQIRSDEFEESIQHLCNDNPSLPWYCAKQGSSAVIDLGDVQTICAIGYHRHFIPYNDLKAIKSLLNRFRYELSLDGEQFFASYEGVITNYGSEQIYYFPAALARYVKITALSSVGNDANDLESLPIIGEISIYRSA